MLGICRGAQMINVALGGTLQGNIGSVYQGRNVRKPLPRKSIRLMPGSRLRMIIGKSRDWVNALHHRAVAVLGRGLQVVARDDHGIVQAIECPTEPFLLGVQWHPEFLVWDSGQQRLYRALVAAARTRGHRATPPESQATEERGLSADW